MDKQEIWTLVQELQATAKTTTDNMERITAHSEIAAMQRICGKTNGGHDWDAHPTLQVCMTCGAVQNRKAA